MRIRCTGIVVLCLVGCLSAGCISVGPLAPRRLQEVTVRESPRWLEPNRVAMVEIEGFVGAEDSLLTAGTTVADVKEKLQRAAEDPGVRAVLLRISTPGGEATASDVVYHEVRAFREESGKPIVAMLMGTAASGGYYAALAADRIVASPTTITGSVGVVMTFVNAEGLLEKIGVGTTTVKSGARKDIASPTRALEPEERELLQGLADRMFAQFRQTVRARRPGMTDEDWQVVADGRPLSAEEALKLHMVDEVGYLDDALDVAYSLAGITEADVIQYRPRPHYNTNIYARSPLPTASLEESLRALAGRREPKFLYLWAPGL
jgi:protease-4